MPEPGNLLAWDRYAYVRNNPIAFNDPTGHCYNYSTPEKAAKCNAFWQQYAAAMQSKYPPATAGPTPTSTPTICVGIMCGSDGIKLSNKGPICTSSGSMSVWTQENAQPGYNITNPQIQYLGMEAEIPYQGKTGQAQNGIDAWQDTIPDVVIGYSAGAESAVQYAQMLSQTNQPLSALVLLGPPFGSKDWDQAKYLQTIENLGIPVLIVDEASMYTSLSISNVTVLPTSSDHLQMDDSLNDMAMVYNWLSEVLK